MTGQLIPGSNPGAPTARIAREHGPSANPAAAWGPIRGPILGIRARRAGAWGAFAAAEAGVALVMYELADRIAGAILVLVLLTRGIGHA
jgi:hypothetical protein